MKKNQKSAFEIKWEKETRKRLIKYVAPIEILIFILFFIILAWAGAESGLGIIGILSPQIPLTIALIVLYIALIPFMWFMSKPECRKSAYEKLLKDMSKSLVEKVMTPEKPIKVMLTKAKGDFGEFVLELQKDEKIELYAVLEKNHNIIGINAVLKGDEKRYLVDVVTKEDFRDFYQFVDTSEDSLM